MTISPCTSADRNNPIAAGLSLATVIGSLSPTGSTLAGMEEFLTAPETPELVEL